jgi:hypothetical protein
MTPAEAVFWDQARTLFDEATVARMLDADDLHRLLSLAVDQQEGQDCPYCGSNHSNGRELSCTECGWYGVAARLVQRLAAPCTHCGGRGGSVACGECGRVAP